MAKGKSGKGKGKSKGKGKGKTKSSKGAGKPKGVNLDDFVRTPVILTTGSCWGSPRSGHMTPDLVNPYRSAYVIWRRVLENSGRLDLLGKYRTFGPSQGKDFRKAMII
eukprot:1182571-Karenia_brevis.AAC.1